LVFEGKKSSMAMFQQARHAWKGSDYVCGIDLWDLVKKFEGRLKGGFLWLYVASAACSVSYAGTN
jgi:hypothetical protein